MMAPFPALHDEAAAMVPALPMVVMMGVITLGRGRLGGSDADAKAETGSYDGTGENLRDKSHFNPSYVPLQCDV